MSKYMLVVLGVVLMTGCKSKCRQLSEKMCECSLNSTTKTACLQVASRAEQDNPPTVDDEAVCERSLSSCDCRLVDTTLGKVRCGLARPIPGVDAGL